MTGWLVYILRCRDGTLYTGITVDLERRLEAHRRGVGAKYTRGRRPVTLAYQECQPDRSGAQKREAALRRLGRAGKLALIADRELSARTRGNSRSRPPGQSTGR
jgi:predicted GIY-YIG superfamily endonuclease